MGVKRFRLPLATTDGEGLRRAIGHRLTPSGFRLPHERPLPVDSLVELEVCYWDGRVALVGRGWVAAHHGAEAELELEWSDGDEPGLTDWLFSADAVARGSLDLLATNEAPDPPELQLEPPVWEGATDEIEVPTARIDLADAPMDRGGEPVELAGPRLAPLGRAAGAPFLEAAPLALTDAVEQAQADLDAQERQAERARAASPSPRSDPPDVPGPSEDGAAKVHEPAWASAAPATGPRSSSEILARIEIVQRELAEALEGPLQDLDPEPGPWPRWDAPISLSPPTGALLAVDFGTSMTAVASAEAPSQVLFAEASSELMPSVVVVEPQRWFAGAAAVRHGPPRPNHTVVALKRLLGRSRWSPVTARIAGQLPWVVADGPRGEVAASLHGRAVPLEELAAVLLGRATRNAQLALAAPSNRVVLTCPAYFGIRQRSALAEAGRLAGLHVERVLSCCIAAAVCWAEGQEQARRKVLIFDLGAGTLDVAVVDIDGPRFTVLGTGGHPLLGGVDFDAAVAQLAVRSGPHGAGSDFAAALGAGEHGKRAFDDVSKVHLRIPPSGGDPVELARSDVEAVWATLVDKALSVTREVCRRAGVAPTELDALVLVGGQSRSPYVERRLSEFGKRACERAHPRAVAQGAAMIGRLLDEPDGGRPFRESLAQSLGYAAPDGAFVPILRRDAWLPAAGDAWLDLPPTGPAELLLYEGDHARVDSCEPYGRLVLEDLPPVRDGSTPLELHLRVDGAGKLAVEVLRGKTRTAVAHRFEPALSPAHEASLGGEPPVSPAPESGFLEWLRRVIGP